MKKMLFLAAATLLLASCTNEESFFEPQAQKEIGFNAVATNASRGAVTSTASFTAPIYVASAYKSPTGTAYSNHFGGNDYVEYTFSSSYWTSATTYYYPEEGTMDFLAFTNGADSATDLVMPTTATINRDGTDSGFSSMVLDYQNLTGHTDVMYAFTPGVSCPQDAAVGLKFYHAMAWLTVGMVDTENTVLIKKLTVDGVNLNGQLTVPVNDHALGTPTWDVTGYATADASFDSYNNPSGKLVNDINDAAVGVLVVPGSQTKLTLTYSLTSNPDEEIEHEINLITNGTWAAGNHYIYTISFSLSGITFYCDVVDYNVVNVPSVNI